MKACCCNARWTSGSNVLVVIPEYEAEQLMEGVDTEERWLVVKNLIEEAMRKPETWVEW